MSMLNKVFADYRKIKKNAIKQAEKDSNGDYHETRKHWIKVGIHDAAKEIEDVCDMLEDERYGNALLRLATIVSNGKKAAADGNRQWYMITIRPDCTKCHFLEFKDKIDDLLLRKCFIEGSYSYEQKAVDPSNIGDGFHVHIVAKMKQASKGQVLRDITSTFKDWIDKSFITPNNIDVRGTKNPDDLINDYLLDYKSEDGHKEVTRAMDELWRTSLGLKRIYTLTQ